MPTTRVLYNSTDEPIKVVSADLEVAPHEHASITAQYQPVIIMENYPGLVDVTDMSEEDQAAHNKAFLKLPREQTDEQG